MHDPRMEHWIVVKLILRYLRATPYGLLLQPAASSTLQAYSDSDWSSDLVGIKSTTDFVIFLGSNLVS